MLGNIESTICNILIIVTCNRKREEWNKHNNKRVKQARGGIQDPRRLLPPTEKLERLMGFTILRWLITRRKKQVPGLQQNTEEVYSDNKSFLGM